MGLPSGDTQDGVDEESDWAGTDPEDGRGEFGREDVLGHCDDLEGECPQAADRELQSAGIAHPPVVRLKLTKAVPAPTLPVVAPDQYNPPTVNKTKHKNVWSGRRMVRRPNLSEVIAQRRTARRLTQLGMSEGTELMLVAAHERIREPRKGSLRPARSKKSGRQ